MAGPTSVQRGTVSLEVSDEFDDLELLYVTLEGGDARAPRELRAALKQLSDRFRVASAPGLRHARVPSAYRAFSRQLGVDPDDGRSPLEAILMDRLRAGRFRSLGLVHDALVLATLESQVPLWAMDGTEIVGGLGIRAAEEAETLGGELLRPGRLIVADAHAPRAALLAPVPEATAVTRRSQATIVFCLRVPGVPGYVAAEALRFCAQQFAFR